MQFNRISNIALVSYFASTHGLSLLFSGANDVFHNGIGWYVLTTVCPLLGMILAMYTLDELQKRNPSQHIYVELIAACLGSQYLRLWLIVGGLFAIFAVAGFWHVSAILLFNFTGVQYWIVSLILGVLMILIALDRKIISLVAIGATTIFILFSIIIFLDGVVALNINWDTISFFNEGVRLIKYPAIVLASYTLSLQLPFAQIYLFKRQDSPFSKVAIQYSLIYAVLSLVVFMGYFALVFGLEPSKTKELVSAFIKLRYENTAGGGLMLLIATLTILTVSLASVAITLHCIGLQFPENKKKRVIAIVGIGTLAWLQLLFFPTFMEWWNFNGKYWYSVIFTLIIPFSILFKKRKWNMHIVIAHFIGLWALLLVIKYSGFFFTLDLVVLFLVIAQLTVILFLCLYYDKMRYRREGKRE